MLQQIIKSSIEQKLLVLAGVLALITAGWYAMNQVPLDAVPDITNNQVQIVTVAPTSPPQEVEQQITFPVELAMQNLPNVKEVRSISRYGLSVVTVVFEESFPLYDARQLVKEQIDLASGEIPDYLGQPEMMPITTGLGEIYQYVLVRKPGYEGKYSLMDLRTIQDWIVKRQLGGTKGIIEVSSFGGLLRQYEVAVDPLALQARQLTLQDVRDKLEANSQNSGGSYIEKNNSAFYIRTVGRAESIEEIEQIVLGHQDGTPILVRHVAEVREGASKRYGAMTMDGKGEVVGGITLMLKGANSSEAIRNVHERMAEVRQSLPEGVDIYPYLDRSELVARTTKTVATNLIEGGLIVIFVLVLLLGNWRAGLIVASVIPLSMLFAFILMRYFGVSANLMSLGAIDFGIIVDGAVIVVEGTLHYLGVHYAGQKLSRKDMNEAVTKAAYSMMRPASFGVMIILVVFLPILTLEGVEGKMFQPMAMTVMFALIGAFILSITYVPAMSALFLKKKISDKKNFSDRIIGAIQIVYLPGLKRALKAPVAISVLAVALLVAAIVTFQRMGSEFVPTLDEGDLAMQMSIPPGSSLEESVKTATQAERILIEQFPEVEHVVSKIGTAEVPTDPMAIEEADIMIILKPRDEWVSATDREGLADKMDAALAVLMGPSFEFTQPIQLRFNELMTGVKADIAIKVFGEDNDELKSIGDEIADLIQNIPGAGDVKVEQTDGLQQLQVNYDRTALARYGVSIEEANAVIRAAYAGEVAGQIYEGERRFDMVVRLKEEGRSDLNIEQLRVHSTTGGLVPLSMVADIKMITGPMQISREQAHRRINIGINVRNRDIGSFIEEVQTTLGDRLDLPAGYYIQYGGQFENLQRASRRLMIAVPVALGLILILLFLSFGSMRYALLIFSGIPLAAIGGVFALYLRGMPFSISAGVGFIALFGVAVLNGLVLINEFLELKKNGMDDMNERIIRGAMTRMRPVIMTATVAALGFLPMALSTSSGAEVQRPLATVVIGGLISSTFLTLFVLPILYRWFENRGAKRTKNAALISLALVALPTLGSAQTPISLDSALAIVEQDHPRVIGSRLSADASRAMEKAAWDLPGTELQGQWGQFNTGRNDNAFGVQQGFHLPGRYTRRKAWLQSMTSTAESEVALQVLQLKKTLYQVYYEWRFYHGQEALWAERNATWADHLERMTRRVELGEDSGLGVIQGKAERARIEVELEQVQREQTALLAMWNYLLGQDSIVYEPMVEAEELKIDPANTGLHPEGEILTREVATAEAYEKVAGTQTWPEVRVGWSSMTLIGEPDSDDPAREYDSGDRLSYFSFGVQTPLLFAHSRAHAQEAKVRRLEQEQHLLDWQQRHRSEWRYWQDQVDLRRQAVQLYEDKILPQAQALEDLASQQMTEGLISPIEWTLLADRAFDMRRDHLHKLWSLRQAEVELSYLTQQL
jgi:cobalt-zinc-cadmium resistance protein CzcA